MKGPTWVKGTLKGAALLAVGAGLGSAVTSVIEYNNGYNGGVMDMLEEANCKSLSEQGISTNLQTINFDFSKNPGNADASVICDNAGYRNAPASRGVPGTIRYVLGK